MKKHIKYKQYLNCSGYDCFNNNKFYRDFLEGNVNHVSYRGLSIEQRPEIMEIFDNLISSYFPTRILEIGTFAGGLTLILSDLVLNTDTIIYTYDINKPLYLEAMIHSQSISNIRVNTHNIFNNQYSLLIDTSIIDIIQKHGLTIVLCDGGCKKCEFNTLAKYLKAGDIIMAHDYAPNPYYFEQYMRNKIWNWHEIQDSDIEEACKTYHLKPFMRDEFLSVAWACFIKESN